MRWIVVCLVLAGCGDDTVMALATVVHVQVSSSCTGASCETSPAIDLWPFCGNDLPRIEPQTTHVEALTMIEPARLAGLVQLQYAGTGDSYGGEAPYLDYTLASDDHVDVSAVYRYDTLLYRIGADGSITDIQSDLLASASGSLLRFGYEWPTDSGQMQSIVEEHRIDAPRILEVHPSEPPACCSVGRPRDLGMVALVLAIGLLRGRRRRYDGSHAPGCHGPCGSGRARGLLLQAGPAGQHVRGRWDRRR